MITQTRSPAILKNLIAVGLCTSFRANICDPWIIDRRDRETMRRKSERNSVSHYFRSWGEDDTTFHIVSTE
jgi:hypothetical protein